MNKYFYGIKIKSVLGLPLTEIFLRCAWIVYYRSIYDAISFEIFLDTFQRIMREKQKKFVTVDSLERKNLSKSFKLPFMYFNQILKNLVDDDQQRGFLFSRIVESIYVWGPRERTSRKFFLIYSLISRIDV